MAASFGQAPAPTNGVPEQLLGGSTYGSRDPIVYHLDLSSHKPGTGGGGGGGGIVLGREQLAEILASSAETIAFDERTEGRLQLNANEILKRRSPHGDGWSSLLSLDRWGSMLMLLCAVALVILAYYQWQERRRASATKNPNTKKEK
mmetsp:Transcript_89/g.283  ORF Transcript_89/g.283 Transcript_89/m.283 type:complete len:147 (+) Transcript_89:380-820(+)|eukprot:CAMPEP_0117677010 /NCGR_PEP_ID=MMETSP0804-20121206/16516_1 /TAXON_ID=1074897 /ORGANISM="Tetraselmis astigmatica, Strain CCMP880" /LENGTH=146 /DNA_ID=CAMNT_0005486263 /DNA_START=292 /DNA_END=732 /DNA_ORIENTATION=+